MAERRVRQSGLYLHLDRRRLKQLRILVYGGGLGGGKARDMAEFMNRWRTEHPEIPIHRATRPDLMIVDEVSEIPPEAWEALASYRRRFPEIAGLWRAEGRGPRPPTPIVPCPTVWGVNFGEEYRLDMWNRSWRAVND